MGLQRVRRDWETNNFTARVGAIQYAEETVTACDSYIWNGDTYTESGEYTYTTTAANGCDSIVTLHLTINATKYTEETVTACDSYGPVCGEPRF